MKKIQVIFAFVLLLTSACQVSNPAVPLTQASQPATPGRMDDNDIQSPPKSPTPIPQLTKIPSHTVQPPTDLPDGKTLQELMLYSHENWSSIYLDATGTWYSGNQANSINSEERHQVWIRRPFYMLAFSGPKDGSPNALYISDGGAYRLPGIEPQIFPDYMLTPPGMPAVDSGLPVQPPESFIPNPLLENIYPIGLASRPGEYRPTGVAVIANRPAYILEWIPEFATQRLNRFWIDSQTGLILRMEGYTKPDGRFLTQEIEVTYIMYDVVLPETLFTLDFSLPPNFSQDYNDLPGYSH